MENDELVRLWDVLNASELLYKKPYTGDLVNAVTCKAIMALPIVTHEHPRGHWEQRIVDDGVFAYPHFRRRWYCSECGEWQTYGKTPYCPYCGAKMEANDE